MTVRVRLQSASGTLEFYTDTGEDISARLGLRLFSPDRIISREFVIGTIPS